MRRPDGKAVRIDMIMIICIGHVAATGRVSVLDDGRPTPHWPVALIWRLSLSWCLFWSPPRLAPPFAWSARHRTQCRSNTVATISMH